MVSAHSIKVSRVSMYSGYCQLFSDFVYGAFTLFGRLSQNLSTVLKDTFCSPNPGLHATRFGLFPFRSPLLWFAPHHALELPSGFACLTSAALVPDFPFPAHASLMCPHISDLMQYRNFNLLSIDYVFRPCLRPRLTQGRSALPWKP